MEIKLSRTNIAGCNGLRQDGDSVSGLIRFDGEPATTNYVVLEFPNLNGINLAIQRLQELSKLWSEREGK